LATVAWISIGSASDERYWLGGTDIVFQSRAMKCAAHLVTGARVNVSELSVATICPTLLTTLERFMRSLSCVLVSIASLSPLACGAQSLSGSSVTAVGKFSDLNSLSTIPATAAVGPGIEFTDLEVVPVLGGYFIPVSFDIGANSIDLAFGYSYAGTGVSFYGYVFTFNSLQGYIRGVTVNPSSSPNINQIVSGWSSNELTFNFAQIDLFTPESNFRFNVSLAPIPEPSGFVLASLGLLALGSKISLRMRRQNGAG
jgi:hypothetical protein